MIKQAVVAIYTLQSVTELQLINKNIVHHDALYTQHPKKKKKTPSLWQHAYQHVKL